MSHLIIIIYVKDTYDHWTM